MSRMDDFLILGGGIAGLTTGYELARRGLQVRLLEKSPHVGGLARTFERDGFRFDLGGHRFHSNNPGVVTWLHELLGADLLTVPRQSRIYLNGRFVQYPLVFPDALRAFALPQATQMLASYLWARVRPPRRNAAASFEDWVVRRFGRQMYAQFFQPYTEKIWGIPAGELSADWAAQRIGLPSLAQAARHALRPAAQPPPTAITQFYYPRHGFGQLPQALHHAFLAHGGTLVTGATPQQLIPAGDHFTLHWQDAAGQAHTSRAAELVSTIPLPQLLALLPPDGEQARLAAAPLAYRGLICLFLAIDKPQISPDHWTYFPGRDFLFGRTHEPKNWSPAMVPGRDVTSLAVEIFASPQDAPWGWSDDALGDRAISQLAALGWLQPRQVRHAWVLRLRHAYPIYHIGYQASLAQTLDYLARWPGLYPLGRTGSFRYLNSDGVIEDVFRFLTRRFAAATPAMPLLANEHGRWV